MSTLVQPSPSTRWWIRLPGPTSTPPALAAPNPDGEQQLVDFQGVTRLLTFTAPCPAGHDARWTTERVDNRAVTTYACPACPGGAA